MKTFKHNKHILESLHRGDRVQFRRGIHSHWGLFAGNEEIIHLTKDRGVKKDNFWKVAGNDKAFKKNKDGKWRPLPDEECLERAESHLGERRYNLLTNNCETFVNRCRYAKPESDQVKTALVVIVGVLVIVGGIWYRYCRSQKNKREHCAAPRQISE